VSLLPPSGSGGSHRRQLLALFERLPDADRETLLAFAEFLAARQAAARPAPGPPEAPNPAPRPAGESVVAAIRRLSAGYPMLDRRLLLNTTSSLMAQHVLHGRGAVEVIDELERVFAALYRDFLRDSEQRGAGSGPEEPDSR
jgi:hypothetical protein